LAVGVLVGVFFFFLRGGFFGVFVVLGFAGRVGGFWVFGVGIVFLWGWFGSFFFLVCFVPRPCLKYLKNMSFSLPIVSFYRASPG